MRSIVLALASSRAMMLGFLCAALGFSYSLATSDVEARAPLFGSGLVGVSNGSLRFTNLFLENPTAPTHNILHIDAVTYPAGGDVSVDPDGFDLGDAVYGSFVTRYLSAAGGVPPYSYSGGPSFASFDTSSLKLERSGRIFGTISSLVATPLSFGATVTDGIGGQRRGNFYIFMEPPNPIGTFHLSDTALANGEVGASYVAKIDTLNGEETLTGSPVLTDEDKPIGGKITLLADDGNHPLSAFYTAAGNVFPPRNYPVRLFDTNTGAIIGVFPRLEDVGLSMTHDGTVFGRPIFSGRLELDVLAFDGRVFPPPTPQYLPRPGTPGTVTFRIAPNNQSAPGVILPVDVGSQTASDMVIRKCTIRTGDTPTSHIDILELVANINPNLLVADFSPAGGSILTSHYSGQPLVVRFGRMSYELTLDQLGHAAVVFPDGTEGLASINPRIGEVRLVIRKAIFRWPFNTFADPPAGVLPLNNPKLLIVGLGIGQGFQACEALLFQNRRNGLRSLLTYVYGNNPGTGPGTATGLPSAFNRTLSGAFLLHTARGMNGQDVAGALGCSWYSTFLIAPRITVDNPAILSPAGFGIVIPDGSVAAPGLDLPTAVQVRIGSWRQSWLSTDPLVTATRKGNKTTYTIPTLNAGVRLLIIDNKKYIGKVVTYPLGGVAGFPRSGIPQAALNGDPPDPNAAPKVTPFSLGIDLIRTPAGVVPSSPPLPPAIRTDVHGEDARLLITKNGREWREQQ